MSKKEFLDEKIIEMMNEVEQPAAPVENDSLTEEANENTIYTGLKIKRNMVYFRPQLFADDKITIMIPKQFVLMSNADAKKKYNSEPGAKIIFTNEDGSINVIGEYLDGPVTNNDMEPIRDHVFGMMRRVNPGIKKHSDGIETVSEKTVAYVEFTNLAMDGKLYNLLFFAEIAQKILMMSFNCSTKNMNYWQKAAFSMMQSIAFVEGE